MAGNPISHPEVTVYHANTDADFMTVAYWFHCFITGKRLSCTLSYKEVERGQ